MSIIQTEGSNWTPRVPSTRICKYCSEPLKGGRKDRVFCDKYCAANYQKEQWRLHNPKSASTALTTNTIAEVNEMKVAIDLLAKGYAVYRAAFQGMPCDMLVRGIPAWGLDFTVRIEVTTGNRTASGTVVHPKRDETHFDVLAIVVGDEIFYKPELTK